MRPSLEQLRKQAKDRLKVLRRTDADATLASVQLTLARELGYPSWPKLVHALTGHPGRRDQLDQVARDLVAAAHRDPAALERFSEFTGSSWNLEQLHRRVLSFLGEVAGPRADNTWTHDEARLAVARHYGFADWAALVASLAEPDRPAGTGRARETPFYDIDWERRTLELRPPLTDGDWEFLAGLIEETGLTGIQANGQMTDAGLARLSQVEQLTRLDLDGSQRVSDDGLVHLRAMPQLRELDLSGYHMRFTDAGLAGVADLPALRRFKACWPQRITDAGVAHLARCERLELVNLMGTATGDGALAVLGGKPELTRLYTGRLVSDRGLGHLHEIPAFRVWGNQPEQYGLMAFEAGPTFLLLDGPVTDAGLHRLAGLDGLFGLSLFWHVTALTSAGLGNLGALPRLGMLGVDGKLCDDAALGHIGALPALRMLLAQGAVAGDDGYVALSRSRTLEHFWGRESHHLGNRGFRALATMPSLAGIALSLAQVDDDGLAALAEFPALTALVPMDVQDDAFRHVGRVERLTRLWCMYCRTTGDAATEHLAGLRSLTTYYAGQTCITDRSLEVLGGIGALEELEFWRTPGITDRGLAHLAPLPRLRKVVLDGAVGITREGVKALPARVEVRYRP